MNTQLNYPLSRVPMFANLSAEELEAISARVKWRTFEEDEEIFEHLTSGVNVFFVIEGAVRVMLVGANGREVAFRDLGEGAYIGEIAALLDTPRSTAVIATTACTLVEMPNAVFLECLHKHPEMAIMIARNLARTVLSLSDRVLAHSVLTVKLRVGAEIVRLAERIDPSSVSGAIVITPAPTQEELANTIGSQRETVNRQLLQLQSAKFIKVERRKITVLDLEGLKQMVQDGLGVMASQFLDWE